MLVPLTMTLLLGGAPANDECAGAIPVEPGLWPGSTVGATTSPFTGTCAPMEDDVWFVHVPSVNGTLQVATSDVHGGFADFDTVLAVFTGTCGVLSQVACNDEAGFLDSQSNIVMPVKAGRPYFVALGGFLGETGSYGLNVVFTPDAPEGPLVNPANGHAYARTPEPMTYLDARAWAASIGGYLVSITDAAEQDFVFSNFSDIPCWIGLTDEDADFVWEWDSGEPFAYSKWATGQPNNLCIPTSEPEDYVSISDALGRWADGTDDNCGGATLPFGIVEVPDTSPFAAVEPGGSGCSPGTPPVLFASPPVLGEVLLFAVTGADPSEPGLLLISAVPGAPFTAKGCEVHLDAATMLTLAPFTADAFGAWNLEAVVPLDASLAGLPFAAQAAVTGGPLELTNGLLMTAGY